MVRTIKERKSGKPVKAGTSLPEWYPSLRQCHADEAQVHQRDRVEGRNKAINMQPNDPGQLANARNVERVFSSTFT